MSLQVLQIFGVSHLKFSRRQDSWLLSVIVGNYLVIAELPWSNLVLMPGSILPESSASGDSDFQVGYAFLKQRFDSRLLKFLLSHAESSRSRVEPTSMCQEKNAKSCRATGSQGGHPAKWALQMEFEPSGIFWESPNFPPIHLLPRSFSKPRHCCYLGKTNDNHGFEPILAILTLSNTLHILWRRWLLPLYRVQVGSLRLGG